MLEQLHRCIQEGTVPIKCSTEALQLCNLLQKLQSVVGLKVTSDTKQSSSSIYLCFFFIDLHIIIVHRFLKRLEFEFKTLQRFPTEMEIQ